MRVSDSNWVVYVEVNFYFTNPVLELEDGHLGSNQVDFPQKAWKNNRNIIIFSEQDVTSIK